ncbi:Patatin protein 3 [Spatholobus suberectus]|nr:Patatin protein 3 [Spatholobus suberectus]
MPVIFSNYKLETETYLNAKLSDICLGTSAAPTYLPAHKFENDGHGFSLIDGAMAANNPALVAVSEVIQHIERKEILLLSLGTGTGTAEVEEKLSGNLGNPVTEQNEIPLTSLGTGTGTTEVEEKLSGNLGNPVTEQNEILLTSVGTGIKEVKKKLSSLFEGVHGGYWLLNNIGVVSEAVYSTDMIQYYLATVFPGLLPADNYLRIQEYNLDPSMEPMDNADEKNMDNLEKVGNDLLQQKVKRMNMNTFIPVEMNQTNAEALDSLAEKLYQERQLRLKRNSMAKGGSPAT